MKTCWSGGIIPPFLTSALDGVEWSASRPGGFTPGEIGPGTYWIGGWVGPRAGLGVVEKRKFLHLQGFEPSPVQLAARTYTDWAIPTPSDYNNSRNRQIQVIYMNYKIISLQIYRAYTCSICACVCVCVSSKIIYRNAVIWKTPLGKWTHPIRHFLVLLFMSPDWR
jgi:hypothetical protein